MEESWRAKFANDILITKGPIKCCPLDPIPSAVLAQLLDVLIPVITTMINLSFETGQFASDWKEALLLPSLKKAGLEVAFKNFRPISNLPFVSKLSEREAADLLMQHAVDQGLDCKFQSAYKKHHSTETALLKVKNDLLMNMDNQHVTLLVLLDLSSAFDTVSHDILLDRLNTRFGVSGIALQWLQSYLADRSQRVSINGVLSDRFEFRHGVPQGSCLGPLLFSLYTSKWFDITSAHLPEVHCYADDTQLYMSFRPNATFGSDEAISAMMTCIADIRDWMISDKLMLNDSKTEILLVGTRQQLRKVDLDALQIGTSTVPLTSSAVRNLGAWFDPELTMNTHVNKLCSAAYFHLYNLRRIRKYLTQQTCEKLVHAFVTSRIDYCNSLLYGLPAKQLDKIQRVQNTAARIIFRLPKFCHITPTLFSLHWLPIRYRIDFKICLLTFKAIHGFAPSYLCELITVKESQRNSRRSSSELLLRMPSRITKKTLGDRAFQVSAPCLWNSLPGELRRKSDLEEFKRHLKAHLFSKAYL